MKCLLVDDEPGIREGLAMLLRRRGFEVHTAADCAAARHQLATQIFDVVVTDWRLPDGVALTFLDDCPCPVLAVSGHPEEVECGDAIHEVLAKPVRPTKLLERIAACTVKAEDEDAGREELPRDVQRVIDDVLAQLPDGIPVTCHDDGTFVFLRADLPKHCSTIVRSLGGDLRIVRTGDRRELELRLCRDGRPDANMKVVGISDRWPAGGAFALDCHGIDAPKETFSQWLQGVEKHRARGDQVCLLNVPECLETTTSVWEQTHDMPMRERVGPRLSAELAELWS